jgi:two-component system sensor histidine kinase TctE
MTLRARLLLVLLLALLGLALTLGGLSLSEARRAVREDLEGALFARLSLLKEEGVSLEELFRLAQGFGGGVGFVVRGEEVVYTDLAPHTLPQDLLKALARGEAYRGLEGGWLLVALPTEGGGFGLRVSLEGVRNLPRRLLLLYLTYGGLLLLLVYLVFAFLLLRALAPLYRLEREVARRSPLDLSPLPVPSLPELRPIVQALNRLFAELEEALSLAQRFAYHASHELRTPLAALKGYLEVLERFPEPRALQGALREARRMEALLQGLLQLARLEGRPLRLEPVDLRGFLLGLGLKEVEGEGRVLADREALEMAVRNLLENARLHGKEPVRARIAPEGGGVWVWVEDRGPGFPPELLERAFEPFVHGGRGLGLGLALVALVARRHGGRVRAENLRPGARVGLWLPSAPLQLSPDAPFRPKG